MKPISSKPMEAKHGENGGKPVEKRKSKTQFDE
jgi:hypothetical protein